MKRADLHFADEKNGYSHIGNFLFKREWENNAEEYNKFVKSLIRKATDTQDFVNKFLNADTAKKHDYYKSDIYQIVLKKYDTNGTWYYCRENMGDDRKYSISDAGGLKVGNDSFSVIIPNGHGDGEMRYAILERENFFADTIFKFFTSFSGENINIYSYDCGEDIIETLPSGRYGAYYYDGLVVLEKWN